MRAKVFPMVGAPVPFHHLQFLILKEPDGEDDQHRYFREKLYLIDQFAEGGKIFIKNGPLESWPKFDSDNLILGKP